MTTESPKNKDENGLTPEEIAMQEIIDQAEEQVETQFDFASTTITAEQEKINELELSLSVAEATVSDQKDAVIRAKAEVDNVRRRAAQDVEKARKFALEKFATEILAVVDNLERAIDAYSNEEKAEGKHEGVNLTLQGLLSTLAKFDIETVNPLNEAFNPELHQAMSMQEVAGVEPNTVIAVLQKGYTLNSRLIRPAMVMVSKAAPSVDTQA